MTKLVESYLKMNEKAFGFDYGIDHSNDRSIMSAARKAIFEDDENDKGDNPEETKEVTISAGLYQSFKSLIEAINAIKTNIQNEHLAEGKTAAAIKNVDDAIDCMKKAAQKLGYDTADL